MTVGEPRILIVRLSALGDVIHTLPCLDVLRRHLPQARIGWVVEELSRDLVEGHPQLDEVFVVPKKRWRGRLLRLFFSEVAPFFRRIRARGFEIAIDFQGLTKSGVAAWLSGARTRVGFGGSGCREINGWFTNRKVMPPAAAHIIDRNLSLLSALGIEAHEYERVLPDRAEWRERIARWAREEGIASAARFVALNPGAGWVTKRWPLEYFAEAGARIVRELGCEILVTWGPGEEEAAGRVMSLMARQGAASRLAPLTTVGESLALLRRVELFIGGDTGPTHLAAAAGVPVVAIFGASDASRNHPAARRQIVLQKLGECDPCWRKTQPAGCDLHCLTNIKPDDVFAAARQLLLTP